MEYVVVVVMCLFTIYAGVNVSRAFFYNRNVKAWTLLAMWAVIYFVYLLFLMVQ